MLKSETKTTKKTASPLDRKHPFTSIFKVEEDNTNTDTTRYQFNRTLKHRHSPFFNELMSFEQKNLTPSPTPDTSEAKHTIS
ncbi:MAG: hypothetical protein P1U61_03425 [Legionellaceae bacterium]|nr:hypothetical protein [Legionellaceae bacterium]